MQLPPRLVITGLNAQPPIAQVNQPIVIFANIVNRGEESSDYTADLMINGHIEQSKTGNIGSHAAHRLRFTVYPVSAGSYSVDLNGTTTRFIVADEQQQNDLQGTIGMNIAIASVVLAMLAIIMLIVVVLRRRFSV